MNPAGSDLDFAGLWGCPWLLVGAAVLASESLSRLAGIGVDGLEAVVRALGERERIPFPREQMRIGLKF